MGRAGALFLMLATVVPAAAQGPDYDRFTTEMLMDRSSVIGMQMMITVKVYNGTPDVYEFVTVRCLGYDGERVVAEGREIIKNMPPWSEKTVQVYADWHGSEPKKAGCSIYKLGVKPPG